MTDDDLLIKAVIGAVICILFFGAVKVFSQPTKNIDITWQWEQAAIDTTDEDFKGWVLANAPSAGGPYTDILEIPYNGTQANFYQASQTNIVQVGTDDMAYFVIRAEDVNGNKSGWSNEVPVKLDAKPPEVPENLQAVEVEVNVTVNVNQ